MNVYNGSLRNNKKVVKHFMIPTSQIMELIKQIQSLAIKTLFEVKM